MTDEPNIKIVNIKGAYVVKSFEGLGVPKRLRNMTNEDINKMINEDWRGVELKQLKAGE